MCRGLRENHKLSAVPCCGKKKCEQLYLESFPKDLQSCRVDTITEVVTKTSCGSGNSYECRSSNCPAGYTPYSTKPDGAPVYGYCYDYKKTTYKFCDYSATKVSCPTAHPSGGSSGCDFTTAGVCSQPYQSTITRRFELSDTTDPRTCIVKYQRHIRPYSNCSIFGSSNVGYMTSPFVTCEEKYLKDACVVYDSNGRCWSYVYR